MLSNIKGLSITFIFLLTIFIPLSVSAESTSDDLVNTVRKLCLAGSGFKLTFGMDGAILLKELSGKASARYTEENLDGVVDVPDSDKLEGLKNVMDCIKPHIPMILNAKIEEGNLKKK